LSVLIVSLAQNVPGPVAVSRLVAGGASAVKIEPPSGDALERLSKPWYDELHAGVLVERVDLKSAAGMTTFTAHLASADLFFASQRPGALQRLGLDAGTLLSRFPRLRHLNIVGDTRNPEHPGHDLTYQAEVGLVHGQMLPRTLIADMAGAERAHAAALQLLAAPPGGRVEVGLADALRDLAAPLRYGLTARGGPLGGANPAYGIYAARDGFIAVAALEPHFRARLYQGLGLPDGSDPSGVFSTKTIAEWEQWARERDLPLVRVQSA
jgi:crotonobetainyl-CoA:carnitine CoA-transferase CaiB-like acyl-CoA transferase